MYTSVGIIYDCDKIIQFYLDYNFWKHFYTQYRIS